MLGFEAIKLGSGLLTPEGNQRTAGYNCTLRDWIRRAQQTKAIFFLNLEKFRFSSSVEIKNVYKFEGWAAIGLKIANKGRKWAKIDKKHIRAL